MHSSVGLEVMNSTNPELNWKTVKKGRRSKKSMTRGFNGDAKVGNSTSPKRVGDFSGSDSDKFGELDLGQSTFGKSESIPSKKRRHSLHSPSPHPWTPSLHRQNSASPQIFSSSPVSKSHEQHMSSSGQRSSNWQLRGKDASAKVRFGEGFDNLLLGAQAKLEYDAGDFSGIELLAAAASMDEDINAIKKKEDLVAEVSLLMPKNSDASGFTSQFKVGLKSNESDNASSNMTMHGDKSDCSPVLGNSAPASKSLCGSSKDGTTPKVNRQHWDLNTLMDAWDEPYDDSIAGNNTSKDVNDDMRMEERQKACSDHVLSNAGGIKDEFSELKTGENKLTVVSPVCSERPSLEEHLSGTQDVTVHDMQTNKISESPIEFKCEDTRDSLKTSEPRGTFFQDGQPYLTDDSEIQNNGTFISGSTINDLLGHSGAAELVAKHEDFDIPNEESKMIVAEDSSKSCSAGAQCDDPVASVGRIGSAIDGPPISDASQSNNVHMLKGDDLSLFQEGYDSPYEDGELRGSVLYSWEDNELENERVDYESDGRNGDGSDDADYHGSEIVEGGSEGSHGTGKSSMLVKRFPEGKSNGEAAKHSLRNSVKDDSYNNVIAGKGSNAGSGTTVEHMDMLMDENDDYMKRSRLMVSRDAFDVKATRIDEYASKMARERLQSRIGGQSSFDATDGKDVFFIQQCRSRPLGSYARPERDISPDKYPGRYNRPANHGERDGVHQWTSWGSRRRYNNSNYQGADGRTHTRPRSRTGDSPDKIGGLNFHDSRQSTPNYVSKGLHRPLMRRSPVERDEYFGPSRRMPLTRGVSNYRNRGHYSQRGGRDFVEDFEQPLPDDAGPPARMSRYMPRRDRSFSPSCGRNSHLTLPPRRRSRSRSRTRSPPRAWHPHRERILSTRRNSRSPDFRSEARIERVRMPFSKPNFASDYGDGYISPSRGRFSPQRNFRWVDDRSNFAENNNMRRRRSPVRGNFRGTRPRFDGFVCSGHRLKSDDYSRPAMRSGRFSFVSNGGRECKLESNFDGNRRRDVGGEVLQRGQHVEDGGFRRFRHNAVGGGDFESSDLNNEDDAQVSDKREVVPETKGDEEDKREFNKI